jgi:hypothetical protein
MRKESSTSEQYKERKKGRLKISVTVVLYREDPVTR